MSRVVVLGAVAMGLAAAHRALTLGHTVTLLEAAPEPGGMAHFDLGGLSIERFCHYHLRGRSTDLCLDGGVEHRRLPAPAIGPTRPRDEPPRHD
jgi:NADPH-dependent 2,4-dienoyl-CoA reductase/sulfur reductase-like enzyme